MSASSLYEKLMMVVGEGFNLYPSISSIRGTIFAGLVATRQKLDREEKTMLDTRANKMQKKTLSTQRGKCLTSEC